MEGVYGVHKIGNLESLAELYLAPGEIEIILQSSFEKAYLEADHIGMDKTGEEFHALCHITLKGNFNRVEAKLEQYLEKYLETEDDVTKIRHSIVLTHYTTRQLKEAILEHYGSRHWLDYFREAKEETDKWWPDYIKIVEQAKQNYGWDD